MTVRLPSTDARRAAALRAELDRAGSAMVPGWGVAVAPGSFGRALLEIAARFAEETSSRLDRTAERDALAFYDTLDVPPPAPQAATATLVFVTEEARTTSTSAPLRVQVGGHRRGPGGHLRDHSGPRGQPGPDRRGGRGGP